MSPFGLFGPPDIEKLRTRNDMKGLIKALSYKKDDKIRLDAAEALGMIGVPAIQPLLIALKNEKIWQSRAAEALAKIGVPAVEPLAKALHDGEYDVRHAAAEALRMIGDASAVKPLLEVLKDDGHDNDHTLRGEAAEALGEIGDVSAVGPLIVALKDREKYMRQTAAEALGKIGDARAVQPLIRSLKDTNDDVRSNVAEALGAIGDLQAFEPLLLALEDSSEYVRMSAAEALGEMGEAAAIQPLIALLRDQNDGVRIAAKAALEKLDYSDDPGATEAVANAEAAVIVQQPIPDRVSLLAKELNELLPSEQTHSRLLAIIHELGTIPDNRAAATLREYGLKIGELINKATETSVALAVSQETMNEAAFKIAVNDIGPKEMLVLTYRAALAVQKRLTELQVAALDTVEKIRVIQLPLSQRVRHNIYALEAIEIAALSTVFTLILTLFPSLFGLSQAEPGEGWLDSSIILWLWVGVILGFALWGLYLLEIVVRQENSLGGALLILAGLSLLYGIGILLAALSIVFDLNRLLLAKLLYLGKAPVVYFWSRAHPAREDHDDT
ncbi:MAG: HEAT repeat domain-containing protein [Chloroflexi bacterium]|nr:MAG: HEAT repeat domain-containing protein [Chloroflexota bacterium]